MKIISFWFQFWLKFVPNDQIDYKSAFYAMTSRRIGDKPLQELTSFVDTMWRQ